MKMISPPRADCAPALVEAERAPARALFAAIPEATHRLILARPAASKAPRSAGVLAAPGRHRHPECEARALAP
jgi:hypothetical protein